MSVKHYHLIAGEVTYQLNAEEKIERLRLNTTIITDTPEVPARHIGQAQQALQVLLFQRLGPVIVHDVFIQSVSPLGAMTAEEFMAGVAEAQAEAEAANA